MVYLFVEGSDVGEAYCPQCMGQQVSAWEAPAMRQHDREKAKAAASAREQVRSDIQEDIEATKKQRRRATREREKGRQLDRQREEIHPSQGLAELESLRPPPASLCLPTAQPDPDREYPVQVLPIRPFKTENDA